MWKTFTAEGQLKFQFLETVTNILPMYVARSVGGALYLSGVFVMVYNIYKTVKAGNLVANEAAEAAPLTKVLKLTANNTGTDGLKEDPYKCLCSV